MEEIRTEFIRPLLTSLSAHPAGRPAYSDGRRTLTHGELARASADFAAGLGVSRGDRVLVHVGSRVEFVVALLAVLRAAAVGVPVSVRSTEAELAHLADDSGATLLITESRHAEVAQRLRQNRPGLRVLFVEEPPPAAAPPRDDLGLDEPAWLLYTSGTTGRPKGVLLSQRAMLWSTAACYVPVFGIEAGDTVVWPLPVHHAYALSLAFTATIALGAHTRLADGCSPELLAQYPGCVLAGVPATYLRLRQEADGPVVSPRLCLTGGAPCTPATRAAVRELFGLPLVDGYGSTETGGKLAMERPGEPGLVPVPGMEVRIDAGEVLVRGPGLMLGYHGQPGSPLRDGWYRTGDAGRFDGGRLVLDGRVDDVIVCGGQNVHPTEIEAVLEESPSVREVLVTGRPDDVVGQVPVAFVVAGPDGFDAEELRRRCLSRLSLHKVPVAYLEVDSIPRTASGKPKRHAMASAPEQRDLAAVVRAELTALCGHDGGDGWRDRPFTDLGLSSLAGVQFRHRITALTGVPVPHSLIYDFPTPGAVIAELTRLASASPVEPPRASPAKSAEPIAVVAMACRFPGGVRSPEDLWRLVADRVDATSEFPADRGWDVAGLYDPDPDRIGHSVTRRGGFLDGFADFDAGMFGISPREALATDPQQRLLLETSWEAFERAGVDLATLRGSDTGVFVGVMNEDYASRFTSHHELEAWLGIGSSHAVASGRISYTFGLTGPALTVDTACSSSLVALHLAVKALREGECSLAVAGGSTVMATPRTFLAFSRQRGLSPDGRCRSYAAGADGTAWSEGAGVILLERLSDARRNGHPVLAVLRGTAVNADGASNGLTAPSGRAQQALIAAALADAGLTAADVDAVEGHGTGTPLGDPIEADALMAAYGRGPRREPLWLGSVKSNIGHTQAAAGIAGVIKVVTALQHEQLPASLHADEPSPHVDWASGAVKLLAEARPWPHADRARRAGVSAFGIGGTNAHVIVEEAPTPEPPARRPFPAAPWLLSAADGDALRLVAAGLADAPDSVDVAYTLARRTPLAHRVLVPAANREALRAVAEGRVPGRTVRSGTRLAVVFGGQGAQRAGMGRELAERFPVFADAFEEACEALGDDVRDVAFAGGETLDRTDHAQAALFAFGVAQYRLFESWGLRPDVLLGHSIGEITAAHVAGVLSLADAATLVAARGRLMAALPGDGVMIAVVAAEADVAPHVGGAVAIASVIGPRTVVLSGERAATTALADRFGGGTLLRVSHAFHSPLLDPMLDEFHEVAAGLPHHRPALPLVSCVTGEPVEEIEPGHWRRHARSTVRFADALATATASGPAIGLEIGPAPTLGRLAADVMPMTSARMSGFGALAAAGAVHTAGVRVDWPAVFAGSGARITPLPTYPFKRTRYWLDQPAPEQTGDHAVLGPALAAPDSPRVVHGGSLGVRRHRWLADHVVGGSVLVPGTLFTELALHAGGAGVEELVIEAPLRLDDGEDVHVQVVVDEPRIDVYARARDDERWRKHAGGKLRPRGPLPPAWSEAWPPAGAVAADVAEAYRAHAYGPAFQAVHRLWLRGEEFFAEVELPPDVGGRFELHPVLLDAAVHATALAEGPAAGQRVPFLWSGVEDYAPGARRARVHGVRLGVGAVRVTLYDEAGNPTAGIETLTTRPMAAPDTMLYRPQWIPMSPVAAAEPVRIVEIAGVPGDVRAVAGHALAVLHDWQGGRDRLLLVTRNATGPDPDPAAAAAWGLGCAAAAEHPGRISMVDLEPGFPVTRVADLAGGSAEPQIAVRDGVPHVLRITRAAPAPAHPIDAGGTVLITGGTGALGAVLARHLVTEHGVRHLLLVSRSGPAAPGAGDLLASLRELGADARIVAADVADRATVVGLVGSCDPPLTAVVHSAAVVDDGVLAAQTPDRLDVVLRPKADAALVLDEVTRHLPLTAFILFSSIAGVFGKAGQANYAAANRVLDAVASRRRAAGLPALSLAWGLWELGTGLGDRISATARRRMQASGVEGLTAEQGLALFDAALGSAEPVLVPVRFDPAASMAPPTGASAVRSASVRSSWPENPAEPELRELLRAEVAAVLGHEDAAVIADDRPFPELGFDSLTVIELRTRLTGLSGIDLPATVVFDRPTVAELARYLLERRGVTR